MLYESTQELPFEDLHTKATLTSAEPGNSTGS